jgi:hypothetical protein
VVRPRGGVTVGPLGGWASCFCEIHIYFERIMGTRQNMYFDTHFAWLKYFAYHLVPVLAAHFVAG